MDAYDDSGGDLNTFKNACQGGGAAALVLIGIVGVAAYSANKAKGKPVNLPSRKKVQPDMDHISSGHMLGGNRNPDGNKSVFWGMTMLQVSKAILEAYSTSTRLQTQGPRIKLIGYSETFNLMIEMWLNIVTYIIETAYPVDR